MSGWLPPALVLAVAMASTYVCCLRPMRSGGCHRTALVGRPSASAVTLPGYRVIEGVGDRGY